MPNMFKCTLASGGALILTVTCDSAFAGQTITCTDGTTTLTQTCPSTSPYSVEFRIPNGGTWTISSGTASTSVTIPSSAELHDIPNGSTITPINDIQIWLHCANIWNKSYTTITQVLNDASTLQALIASNNAADYLARSTTWSTDVTSNSNAMMYIGLDNYCSRELLSNSSWLNAICNSSYFENVLNVKVPSMTSNTTPSGVASASSYQGSSYAYKAFSSSGAWISADNHNTGEWLQYKFESPMICNYFEVTDQYSQSPYTQYSVKNYQVLASNDGTNFTTLYSGAFDTQQTKYQKIPITNDRSYKYFRYKCVSVFGGDHIGVANMQFYGRASS